MIPLLPADYHLDFTRELGRSRKPGASEWPDGVELVMTREIKQRNLHPDPISYTMNRLWTRMSVLRFGALRKES